MEEDDELDDDVEDDDEEVDEEDVEDDDEFDDVELDDELEDELTDDDEDDELDGTCTTVVSVAFTIACAVATLVMTVPFFTVGRTDTSTVTVLLDSGGTLTSHRTILAPRMKCPLCEALRNCRVDGRVSCTTTVLGLAVVFPTVRL